MFSYTGEMALFSVHANRKKKNQKELFVIVTGSIKSSDPV